MALTRREAMAAQRARDAEQARQGQPFTILTVCTGNICRSPMAEQLLRAGLADMPGVQVASAGTMAMPGDVMPIQAEQLSRRFGGDATGHQARRLLAQHVEQAGLVLALAREHRAAAVRLAPRATGVTFTLREFARLSRHVDQTELQAAAGNTPNADIARRLRRAVALVASLRGTVDPPSHPEDDDVIDPYRRDDSVYARSADQLVPAVNDTVSFLRRALAGTVLTDSSDAGAVR